MLAFHLWQPFVHYEYGGATKQTDLLCFGEQYSLPRDAPGRNTFGDSNEFSNPDFAGCTNYKQMVTSGIRHARTIIEDAQTLGTSVGIYISPLESPMELARLLPETNVPHGINDLLVAPGTQQTFADTNLKWLVTAKLRAYLNTYPSLDAFHLTMPEFPNWNSQVDTAWRYLKNR